MINITNEQNTIADIYSEDENIIFEVQAPTQLNIELSDGTYGVPGKSAYEVWLEAGNVGTQNDFFESLGNRTPVILTVVQNNQRIWNLGMGEKRNLLFINGHLYLNNVHYTIQLPYLNWIGDFNIDIGDEVVLK